MGLIPAFLLSLFDQADERRMKKSMEDEYLQSMLLVNLRKGTSKDYYNVMMNYNSLGDMPMVLRYSIEYKELFTDSDIIQNYFEAKALVSLERWDEAYPILVSLEMKLKQSGSSISEEPEVLMWLALFHRRRGEMDRANDYRERAIRKDKSLGTGYKIKSMPW